MSILTSAIASLGSMYSEVRMLLFSLRIFNFKSNPGIEGKSVSARPDALYQRRCGVAGEHGQANL